MAGFTDMTVWLRPRLSDPRGCGRSKWRPVAYEGVYTALSLLCPVTSDSVNRKKGREKVLMGPAYFETQSEKNGLWDCLLDAAQCEA